MHFFCTVDVYFIYLLLLLIFFYYLLKALPVVVITPLVDIMGVFKDAFMILEII